MSCSKTFGRFDWKCVALIFSLYGWWFEIRYIPVARFWMVKIVKFENKNCFDNENKFDIYEIRVQ